jgi:periplasmic protein TonB
MTETLRIDAPLLAASRPRPMRTRSWIGIAAVLSVGLHVALIGLGVLWARHLVPVALAPLEIPATVQLEMSPPGGATPPAATPQPATPPSPKPSKPAATVSKPAPAPAKTAATAPKTAPTQSRSAATDAKPPEMPETAKDGALAAQPSQASNTPAQLPAATTPTTSPAEQTAAAAKQQPAAASPPPAPQAQASGDSKLTFDFADAESDTNALVTGDLMVPASPDVKYHNRKPSYPLDAAWRGEQGTVTLLVHVSPDGLVRSVDVLRSSGFSALDHAAEDAVVTWHFLPSVKDGHPVSADVPMRFAFELD